MSFGLWWIDKRQKLKHIHTHIHTTLANASNERETTPYIAQK